MGLDAESVWLVREKALQLVRDKLNIRIDDFGFELLPSRLQMQQYIFWFLYVGPVYCSAPLLVPEAFSFVSVVLHYFVSMLRI
jgi:hypothetical protein